MSTLPVFLGLVTLLASCALGAPHREDNPQTRAVMDQPSPTGQSTTTVSVTSTYTSYTTQEPPKGTGRYTLKLDVPPSPASVKPPSNEPGYNSPTGIAATITCPHPTEPCTINGIPVRPSGTMSLFLPSFTYEPLPTSPASAGLMNTSTTCSHTMSHIVPSEPSHDLPWITHPISMSLPSGGLTSTSSSSTAGSLLAPAVSDPPSSNAVVPTTAVAGTGSSEFNWPTRSVPTSSSSNNTFIKSASVGSMTPNPLPKVSITATVTADSSISPTISVHPRCKTKIPMKVRDTEFDGNTTSAIHSSTLVWTTKYIDASAFTGMENATPSTRNIRAEENRASSTRRSYWTRFFAVADPLAGRAAQQCLACDHEGEITCLPDRRYSWCTGGCAVTEKLGCDMVCEPGVIRKEGKYCVR